MSHVNIQINIQYVTETPAPSASTNYPREAVKPLPVRQVREERINVSGSTPAAAFKRAKNALKVLSDSE